MADYVPITATSGNLRGLCPDCEALIYRRISLMRLEAVFPDLDIKFAEGRGRIRERTVPSVDCDSDQESSNHENPQSKK